MERHSNKAPARKSRLDGLRFYIFCAFLISLCVLSMALEKEEQQSKSTYYGYDNSKPAPWQDEDNVKLLKAKYERAARDN
jgi:hypothetical protein